MSRRCARAAARRARRGATAAARGRAPWWRMLLPPRSPSCSTALAAVERRWPRLAAGEARARTATERNARRQRNDDLGHLGEADGKHGKQRGAPRPAWPRQRQGAAAEACRHRGEWGCRRHAFRHIQSAPAAELRVLVLDEPARVAPTQAAREDAARAPQSVRCDGGGHADEHPRRARSHPARVAAANAAAATARRACLLYTSPSPRDRQKSRMPSSA